MKRAMTRLPFASALACALVLPIAACGGGTVPPTVYVKVPLPADEYRLPNGLTVAIHEDHSFPHVAVDLRYHVGSKDDPPGRSGFAHLFEHLMFGATRHVKANEFFDRLHDAGGRGVNAFTNRDGTDYHEVVPPWNLELALWLESDRMAYLTDGLDEGAFKRERDVVKNEWREHYDDVACGHVRGLMTNALYPEGHPYKRLPIGSPADLDAATLAEARAFHARYYVPNNATLVIAGDIDAARVRLMVDKYFGAIPAGRAPLSPPSAPPVRLAHAQTLAIEANVERPRVVVMWPIPAPYRPGWYELDLARRELIGYLNYQVKTQDDIAESASVNIDEGRLGSTLTVTLVLKRGESLSRGLSDIELAVKDFRKNAGHVSGWRDFSDDRIQPMVDRVFELEPITTRANQIQDYLSFFGRADSAQDELRAMQEVDPKAVSAATEYFLEDADAVVAFVTPNPAAPLAGRLQGGAP